MVIRSSCWPGLCESNLSCTAQCDIIGLTPKTQNGCNPVDKLGNWFTGVSLEGISDKRREAGRPCLNWVGFARVHLLPVWDWATGGGGHFWCEINTVPPTWPALLICAHWAALQTLRYLEDPTATLSVPVTICPPTEFSPLEKPILGTHISRKVQTVIFCLNCFV